jgi:hypothetical protein
MPLPEGFSPWEHLQATLIQTYNRAIRDEFNDVGDETWEPEITTPRGTLRVACTLRDDDSAIMTIIRMMLYYFVLRKANDLQSAIYGIPVHSYQETWKFKPQVHLYFQEDPQDVEAGYAPVTGEINFRLANESYETMTMAEVNSLANRVQSNFATAGGFIWRKGKVMCSYADRSRGYKLQILARDKTEGRRVIEQVLDIQGHTPDWEYLNVTTNEEIMERYPTIPPTRSILGKSRRLPRKRPVAEVRFRHALLHVWGLPNPVVLIDREHVYRNPIIRSA